MSRTAVRLTPDTLDALPAPCRSCLFWELDPVRRGRVEDPACEKLAWVSEVLREWGSCGRVALVDDAVVGHVLYAPAAFVPGAGGFATAPVSADAVLMTTVHVDADQRGYGVGRMLVRAMARDLVERDVRAVEAFGTWGRGAGACQVPVDFLSGVGFRTHRPHATTPRMRMDLRTAISWKGEVEAAVERLVGLARPRKEPRPAPRGAPRSGAASEVGDAVRRPRRLT